MFKTVSLGLVFILCGFVNGSAQSKEVLLMHSNKPIPFDKIRPDHIVYAVATMIKQSDARISKIAAIPAGSHSVDNTLMAVDELGYDLADLIMKLSLIASTYQDDSTRNIANSAAGELSLFFSNLYLNKGLYRSLKSFSSSNTAKTLKPNHRKFLRETILSFEKNGMKLGTEAADALKLLNKKLVNYGIAFDRNISEYKDSIAFTEDELSGLPSITINPWKRGDGRYIVYINGPNYTEIMSNAEKPETRLMMFKRYNNRAYPANIKVLDSLLFYRQQYANTLGFRSYAEYALTDKMAKTPVTVWQFENDLITKLTPLVIKDIEELRTVKHQLVQGLADTIFEYDLSYYRKKLLDTKYQLNTDEVKEYFELNNTLLGMFHVYQKLFGLTIKELKGVPLWHPGVRAYEMYKEGVKIGTFYLDLFPRPDKYTHFACFPISQYRSWKGTTVLPVSALVCNFPEAYPGQPSMLYHTDVITLFHEFGHLVHSMLGRSDLATQGPFAVKGDFVEAPSQFLENWVWEYESLKLFAKHYKTGKILPESLFNKMKATQTVGSGNYYIRQVNLGIVDFTFEDKYDSIKGKDLVEVSRKLAEIRRLPFVEGSHYIASFGHLNSYAANYYGYLWSRVFAEDMFSVFKKNGIMDAKTGIRYRKEVLEKAATKEELDMLRSFLGREPNANAFLKSLGTN